MDIHHTVKVLYAIANLSNNNSYFSTIFFFAKTPIMDNSTITEFISIRNGRIGIL